MEDREIISLYFERDPAAIDETASKYGSLLRTVAVNILSSREDAEECVNDTYLGAWNAIPPQKPDILSAWLTRLTRNLSFDRFRRRQAKKRGGGQTEAVLEELAECVSGKDSTEEEIDRKELIIAINGFLEGLSRDRRSIFICRYWYAFSVSDIAKRFGMSENNVSVTLNRLRGRLKKHLEERGFEL